MVKLTTNYLLFDLDGTLVNSTPAVEQTWHDVVEKHNKTYPANIIDQETGHIEASETVESSGARTTLCCWMTIEANVSLGY